MKKTGSFIVLFITITFIVKSQDIDSITLSKLKLNFAVPDMPAFKTLGTDPSNLLRPSTVQAIALNVSSFNDKGKFIIPKAFAMEISPALLLNNKKGLTQLAEYAKRAVVNSFRISLGTSTDSLQTGRNLALGLRVSLIDKGDPTTDIAFQKIIAGKLRLIRKSERAIAAKKDFIKENRKPDDPTDDEAFINLNLKDYSKFFQDREDIQKPFQEEIKAEKEKYRKEHWNDDKLDIAIAILSSSPDSLFKNIKFNKASFWGVYAIKAGKSGQFIVGLNGQVYKNLSDTVKATRNKTYTSISIPMRYLIGTNRVKGFAELQLNYASLENQSTFLMNLGSELNIVDGIWINIFAGLDYNSVTKTSSFITNLNLKLTLPENFKFF
ncbi:MAG TPA: hypothetical protein VK484_03255 [Ferruginibacter sp.]|nr:hypothetical protein [Ferruginibacter sp.]